MGNLLVCFKSSDAEQQHEEEFDGHTRSFSAPYTEEDPSSEEKVERRGSVFPPSPSAYRSSLTPSSNSIIPPYVSGTSGGRASVGSNRRGTHSSPIPGDLSAQKKAKEVRILLLGSGESGKSTITKQMKIIHQNGYSREEMISFRPAVYRNIKQGIEQIITAAQKLHLDTILEQCSEAIETTRQCGFDPETVTSLPKDFIDAVNYIWVEGGVKSIFDQLAHASYIFDSAGYFFDNVSRIGKPDYIPSTEDILRARIKTSGIAETLFRSGLLTIRMIDIGGQRPERKNWIKTFEGVTTIIFCVSLSEFDQCLLEEPTQNRLLESFQLFQSIVTSRWFVNTSIVLFLNKKDIFQRKIVKIPLSDYFPDFEGGREYGKATDFIKQKFLSLNVNKLQIYPYLTEATDTNNINLVFAAVKETVLANSLKQSGLF